MKNTDELNFVYTEQLIKAIAEDWADSRSDVPYRIHERDARNLVEKYIHPKM